MQTIEIDDELFGYLQSKAIPFVETPNLTLRRLLLGDSQKAKEPPKPGTETRTTRQINKKEQETAKNSFAQTDSIRPSQSRASSIFI